MTEENKKLVVKFSDPELTPAKRSFAEQAEEFAEESKQRIIWEFSLKLISEFRKCGDYFTKEMAENITYCQAKIPAHHKPEMDRYLNVDDKWKDHSATEIFGAITNIGPKHETALLLQNKKSAEVVRQKEEEVQKQIAQMEESYKKATTGMFVQGKNTVVGATLSGDAIKSIAGIITNTEPEGLQCTQAGIIPLKRFSKMLDWLQVILIALIGSIILVGIFRIMSNGQQQRSRLEIGEIRLK